MGFKYIVTLCDKYEMYYDVFDNYQEAWEYYQENKNGYKHAYLAEIICQG